MKVWSRSSEAGESGRSVRRASKGSPGEPGDAVASADCSTLEETLRQAQAIRWRYHLAQLELDRLRQALRVAEKAREQQGQRREALVEAVADSVPTAMLASRRQGWDEGWETAQAGFPKSVNPHRSRVLTPEASTG